VSGEEGSWSDRIRVIGVIKPVVAFGGNIANAVAYLANGASGGRGVLERKMRGSATPSATTTTRIGREGSLEPFDSGCVVLSYVGCRDGKFRSRMEMLKSLFMSEEVAI
jgi:hypothetical protein